MLLERFKAIENLSSFRRGSEATEIAADSSTEIAQLAPPVSRLPILLGIVSLIEIDEEFEGA